MKRCSKCGESKPVTDFSRNRRTKDGLFAWCKPCARERAKEWGKANPERKKANFDRWAAANPERKAELRREWHLRTTLGITRSDYDRMLREQGDQCAICKRPPKGKRILVVDHCHDSGRVRGLLCDNCNTALGLMADDVKRLQAAVRYLRR